MSHTPGPWHLDPFRKYANVHGEVMSHLARVPIDTAEAEANARLIAAAPDLLEACREALSILDYERADVETRAQVYAAIAKAEGRASLATEPARTEKEHEHNDRCTVEACAPSRPEER